MHTNAAVSCRERDMVVERSSLALTLVLLKDAMAYIDTHIAI